MSEELREWIERRVDFASRLQRAPRTERPWSHKALWQRWTRVLEAAGIPHVGLGKCTVSPRLRLRRRRHGQGRQGDPVDQRKKVAEGRIKRTVAVVFSTDDTFDAGEDWGTPVSPTYKLPFKFTGALKQVTVEVK